MDFHDVSTSLGGRYQFNDWMAGALSYTQLFYIPRSVEPGTSRPPEMDAVSSSPDANGTYKQSIGVLNVNLQTNFDVLGSSDEVPIDGGEQAGARRIPGLQ